MTTRIPSITRLISKTLMMHTREAEMFVLPKKVVYHFPYAFQEERTTELLTVRKGKDGIWVETTVPQKRNKEELFMEEE